ncbi:MAG TPA: hypothetical protein VK558_11950 [Patescibacteria group bacterium]|nr:hypothetical protein [Patescibacteria group bacterium]
MDGWRGVDSDPQQRDIDHIHRALGWLGLALAMSGMAALLMATVLQP